MKIPINKEIFPYKFPQWEEINIKDNINAYLIKNISQPLVNIKIIIKYGSYSEIKYGLASMTSKLLMRGTLNRTAEELNESIDKLGISLNINANWDETIINLITISDYQSEAVNLMLDCINNPRFDETEFEKIKKRQLSTLELEYSDPETMVSLAFNSIVFENSGYSHNILGNFESINDITIDDIKDFYENFKKSDTFIVVSGNYSNDIFHQLNKNLIITPSNSEILPPPPQAQRERTIITDKKDASQINLRIGKKTIDRNHPDYHLLSLANTIFGGYFLSRLNKKIREELGLTYGISSYFDSRKFATSWQIVSAINNNSLMLTLDTIEKELELFYEKRVEFDELNTARNYLMGNFLRALETPHQIASMVATIKLLDLKDSYYDDFYRKINYANVESLSRIQKKYFGNHNLIYAFSGNAEIISKELLENYEIELEYYKI